MITKRTDSYGLFLNDKRLKTLSNCLEQIGITSIYELNDHKGDLEVVWENKIDKYYSKKVEEFWNAFGEFNITHSVKKTDSIYLDLYDYLLKKYPLSVIKKNGLIYVDSTAGLFDYTKYEFYNVSISDMKLGKIVNKFSNNFYCEWQDCFTQLICK